MKKWIGIFSIAALGAAMGAGIVHYAMPAQKVIHERSDRPFIQPAYHMNHAAATPSSAATAALPDFVAASKMATPAVVHIKSYIEGGKADPFGGMFGNPWGGGNRPQASGSGVIISADGFITTNNHVIRNAEKVEVILEDKRSYIAEVVGKDPTTDLALLKIDGQNLDFLHMANSNDVQIGEWVLAVGNPFNLTSTVTAGIVSAKGRSLNLLNEEFAIESFIQTDAAVNPGNSGGALINTTGNLVGINTAIASETGSYAGYSFAVPVNIVRKVMEDLKEFGEVQRGIIGVQIRNINAQFAEQQSLDILNGAYVTGTLPGGAAQAAGIKAGDVITAVGNAQIRSASELQEVIGTYRPGEKVWLKIVRDNKPMELDVILRNREGKTSLGARRSDDDGKSRGIASKEDVNNQALGARLEQITFKDKFDLGIDNGVKVARVEKGALQEAGIERGFIITRVNKEYVETPNQVQDLIKDSEGSILIEGVTPEGKRKFYAFDN